jgi:hypothetical protein
MRRGSSVSGPGAKKVITKRTATKTKYMNGAKVKTTTAPVKSNRRQKAKNR